MDQQAALGVATTRVGERILASLGKLQAAPIRFEQGHDRVAADRLVVPVGFPLPRAFLDGRHSERGPTPKKPSPSESAAWAGGG